LNIHQTLVKCQFSPKLSFSFMVSCSIQKPNDLIVSPGEPRAHERMETYATPMRQHADGETAFYTKIILTEFAHPILIRSRKILMKQTHEYFKDNRLLVKHFNSALLLLIFCLPSSLCQCLS